MSTTYFVERAIYSPDPAKGKKVIAFTLVPHTGKKHFEFIGSSEARKFLAKNRKNSPEIIFRLIKKKVTLQIVG